MYSPDPVLTRVVLIILNESSDKTKTHGPGKGTGKEDEGLVDTEGWGCEGARHRDIVHTCAREIERNEVSQ